MANCYENRSMSQATDSPGLKSGVCRLGKPGASAPGTYTHAARRIPCRRTPPVLIDLMWPGNAMVFPAQSLPRTPIRGGNPRPRPLDSGSKPAPYHDAGAGMTRDRRHFHPLGLRKAIVIPNGAERSEESKDLCSQDQVRGRRADALDSSTALRALGMTEKRAPAS